MVLNAKSMETMRVCIENKFMFKTTQRYLFLGGTVSAAWVPYVKNNNNKNIHQEQVLQFPWVDLCCKCVIVSSVKFR